METPRKFIIAELSIRKLGSSSVLIIHCTKYSSSELYFVYTFIQQSFQNNLKECNMTEQVQVPSRTRLDGSSVSSINWANVGLNDLSIL